MLLLVFHAGGARYGLEAAEIIEVLPALALRPLSHTSREVAGLLNYRGRIVPVLDLTAILTGSSTKLRMSSRIAVIDFLAADGERHPLGLLVERATETIRCREHDFQPTGIRIPEAPFSGDILVDGDGTVQKVEVQRLLPVEMQRRLFAAGAGTAA